MRGRDPLFNASFDAVLFVLIREVTKGFFLYISSKLLWRIFNTGFFNTERLNSYLIWFALWPVRFSSRIICLFEVLESSEGLSILFCYYTRWSSLRTLLPHFENICNVLQYPLRSFLYRVVPIWLQVPLILVECSEARFSCFLMCW